MRRQFLFVLLILFIGSNELWAQGGPKPPATKAEVKKKSEPKAKPQKIDADDPKPLEKDKGEEAKDKDAKDSEVKNKQAEKAEKIEAARSAAPIPSHGQGGRVGPFPNEQILVGRAKRAYRLTVPKSYRPDKAVPLVFAFHGLGDSKDLIPIYTALDQTAEKHGFILVYPNAANRMWPIVEVLAQQDFEFFDKLYADLTARYNIDLRRVYLTGMSNGAFFSNLLASQRPDKIAAIAPHSGGLGALAFKGIDVHPKYAVLIIHGEKDRIVKVEEGRKARDLYRQWGHEVEYIEIPNHPHFWAFSIDVNTKIWKFFVEHPLQVDEKS